MKQALVQYKYANFLDSQFWWIQLLSLFKKLRTKTSHLVLSIFPPVLSIFRPFYFFEIVHSINIRWIVIWLYSSHPCFHKIQWFDSSPMQYRQSSLGRWVSTEENYINIVTQQLFNFEIVTTCFTFLNICNIQIKVCNILYVPVCYTYCKSQ